jgi:hypothetical protein
MGIETRLATGIVAASDGFEYADLTALVAGGWTLTDTMGGLGTPSIETSEVHGGSKALRIEVTGTTASSQDCYYTRTFTGLTPGALYQITLYVWENEEANGSVGIACGLRVTGGTGAYVEQDGAVGVWQQVTASGVADDDGHLTVQVGYFHSLVGGIYARVGIFDDLVFREVGDLAVLIGAGVLSVDGAVLGLSRDGWTFDPRITYDTWEYDGQLEPIAGTDVRRTAKPVLSGTLIELGATQLRALEPLAAFVTDAGVTTTVVTPTASGTAITFGDLLVNVVAVWPRLQGGFHKVTLPYALCTKYHLTGKDKSEPGVPIELEGRASAAGQASYTHTVLYP